MASVLHGGCAVASQFSWIEFVDVLEQPLVILLAIGGGQVITLRDQVKLAHCAFGKGNRTCPNACAEVARNRGLGSAVDMVAKLGEIGSAEL